MKFKIIEQSSNEISSHEAKQLLQTDYSEAAKAQPIYRGIYYSINESPFIITPNPFKPRQSANTTNYYTLIINNSPIWKGFPKRQFIATTSITKASHYTSSDRNFYRMYPKNGAKIGICPGEDIWDSGMADKNNILQEILTTMWPMGIKNRGYDITNYKEFVQICKDIDLQRQDVIDRFNRMSPDEQKFLEKYLNSNVPFLRFIQEEWYNPKKLGFEWKPIAGFKVGPNQEVWTDATCLFIHDSKEIQQRFYGEVIT